MDPTSWEVELKFHVEDVCCLENRLEELGFVHTHTGQHQDIYFRHPSRDFKSTDEALRVRQIDSRAWITYKGPRSSAPVKTREEIELPIEARETELWRILLDRLGFQALSAIRKTRREFRSSAPDYRDLNVVIDRVEELGEFAEIELVVTRSGELAEAQNRVLELAERLNLTRREPRSYLDQILERRAQCMIPNMPEEGEAQS